MNKICDKCGLYNLSTSHYCARCGNPLDYKYIFYKAYGKKEYILVDKDSYKLLQNSEISLRDENASLKKQLATPWLIRKFKVWDWETMCASWVFWGLFIAVMAVVVYFVEKPSKPPIEIVEGNSKYGIYDNVNDKQLVACEYDSIIYKKDAGCYYFLYKHGKVGLADSAVVNVVEAQFDSLNICGDNYLVISYKNGKQGLFDEKCHEMFACENYRVLWDEILPEGWSSDDVPGRYVGDIIPIKYNESSAWFLYNRNGKRISETAYAECVQTGIRNLIVVEDRKRSRKKGIVDVKGNIVLPLEYLSINTFSCNRAWVKKTYGKEYSCINEKGEVCFTIKDVEDTFNFSEGLGAIEKNGKIGFVDILGTMVIPLKYSIVYNENKSWFKDPSFNNGTAIVSDGKHNGRIDKKGVFTPDNTVFDN